MKFSHFNEEGRAHMVEVGEKKDTERIAVAQGSVRLKKEIIDMIKNGEIKKGDVLAVAQVSGIMAAKKTSELIPMCHNIFITGADIEFNILEKVIEIQSTVKTIGKTGVEMEALTAVSVAALTIYDMCKSVDKGITIGETKLIKKTGGKSGDFERMIDDE